MVYISINAVAIIFATLAGLGAGLTYYLVFDSAGSTLRTAGRARKWKLALVAFLAQLWLASILAGALILAPAEADAWIMALGSAIVIWIGFVAPVIVVTQCYREVALRTAVVDCIHWLVVMAVQATVLFSIGLQPPPA